MSSEDPLVMWPPKSSREGGNLRNKSNICFCWATCFLHATSAQARSIHVQASLDPKP